MDQKKLFELSDKSSYTTSSYTEFTVFGILLHESTTLRSEKYNYFFWAANVRKCRASRKETGSRVSANHQQSKPLLIAYRIIE